MLVWCWFIVVSQAICFKGDQVGDVYNNSKRIAIQQLDIRLKESHSADYNFNPDSQQIPKQGLSTETIQIATFFKKKDAPHYYNLFRTPVNCKHFIKITYILSGNPIVNYHWICRIQV
jgi:hypothetical protein